MRYRRQRLSHQRWSSTKEDPSKKFPAPAGGATGRSPMTLARHTQGTNLDIWVSHLSLLPAKESEGLETPAMAPSLSEVSSLESPESLKVQKRSVD